MALRFQATRQNFANITDKKLFFYGSRGILCTLGIVGTLASLLVYGRVLLPLPDMVSNVAVLGVGKVGGVRNKYCTLFLIHIICIYFASNVPFRFFVLKYASYYFLPLTLYETLYYL